MKKNLIVAALLFLSGVGFGQTTQHEFECLTSKLTFELPGDFRTHHSHYEKGYFEIFFRQDTINHLDTTRLSIHCGGWDEPHDLSDSVYKVEQTSELGRSGTQSNGRFWRELNFPDKYYIFYQDATTEEKKLFDQVIEEILVQLKVE